MSISHPRLLALVLLASLFAPGIALADQTVEIFNGKDFNGWTKRGGKATYSVENGEVIGHSAPNTTNTFMCTDKEYGDFELEYDFKIADTRLQLGRSNPQPPSPGRKEAARLRLPGRDRPESGSRLVGRSLLRRRQLDEKDQRTGKSVGFARATG